MWSVTQIAETDRIMRFSFADSKRTLSFSDVMDLLKDSPEFRDVFVEQFAAVPFSAFRWETPAVSAANKDRAFECVVLDSPGLARRPDVTAFASCFSTHTQDDIAVFPNIGNDAIMIVPCPVASETAYGHLAAFLRKAPDAQKHALWARVGKELSERISDRPVWLSTAGAGVSWLHVRLDSRPKYYGYAPYRKLP